MSRISKRYAKALFEAAPENARDAIVADLDTIAEVLTDPMARVAVTDPDIPSSARRKACEKLGERAQDSVQKLIRVLLDRRRERVLLDINVAFRELVLAARGEVEGVVESAADLDQATLDRLAETASRLTGKKVLLRVERNDDLLGGVRMRVGTTMFDSSVATAIEELERKLMTRAI